MKIIGLFFVLLASFNTIAFSREYNNEEYGLYLVVPDHWKVVEFDNLPSEKQMRLAKLYHPFKTLAVCGYRSQDGLDVKQIIIQFRKFEKSNYNKAKKFILTEKAQEMMISSAEVNAGDAMGREITHFKLIDSNYGFHDDSNMAYGIVYYENSKKASAVAMEAKIVCKGGWINLCCFSKGLNSKTIIDIVNDIAKSIEFRENSIFVKKENNRNAEGSQSHEQIAETIWKWLGIVLTLLIVGGILKMLLFRN